MPSREKYMWQSLIGLVTALYLAFSVSETSNLRVLERFLRWVTSGFANDLPPKADLMLPFFKTVSYPLGVFGFIAMTYFVIVGASNAVNLTDGLDGLAIMPVVLVAGALGLFAYVVGNAVYSKYLLFPYIPRAGAGRRAGHGGRDHAPGDRAGDHGRRVRGRGAVGDGAGQLLQVHEEEVRRGAPHPEDGAAAPPFREVRLDRDAGRDPLLDRHDAAVPGRPRQP